MLLLGNLVIFPSFLYISLSSFGFTISSFFPSPPSLLFFICQYSAFLAFVLHFVLHFPCFHLFVGNYEYSYLLSLLHFFVSSCSRIHFTIFLHSFPFSLRLFLLHILPTLYFLSILLTSFLPSILSRFFLICFRFFLFFLRSLLSSYPSPLLFSFPLSLPLSFCVPVFFLSLVPPFSHQVMFISNSYLRTFFFTADFVLRPVQLFSLSCHHSSLLPRSSVTFFFLLHSYLPF